ncbi:MAG: small acid-soluble spore protein Tlp [Firmicutes bacterium]|jgi:small acid-soluble spore protein (thioredoxin-like protein)|nr:small acid-soluble spore protein Tlp [Bacillota bacterium]NLL89130.1 small acid-soluble spore protein Tlp [Bacillota bacterium]HKM18310.1 small acid-soluble spore protein Tlp [Limnochordia bacterium]
MPKPKPDDRSDNVDKLQEQVVNTIENLEAAHETLQNEDLPEEQRRAILEKNRRRERAIAGKRAEIKDEYQYQQTLQQNKEE